VAVVPESGFRIDTKKGFLRILCVNENHLLLEAAKRIGEVSKLLTNLNKIFSSSPVSNLAQYSLITDMNKSAGNHAGIEISPIPSNQLN
jgi:hypothetical protein